MCHTLKKGATSKLLFVYALDSTDGHSGRTGLDPDMQGAGAAYAREGNATAQCIPLTRGSLGEYHPGSFLEVDPEVLPGVYQLGLPDEMLVPGADSVMLLLKFPGAIIEPIVISLVAYDPQDSNRLGLSALGPEGRIAALRGAFPRLTAKELQQVP
jgi:hypothetical protein